MRENKIKYNIFSLLLNLYYQELYASTLFKVSFDLIKKYFLPKPYYLLELSSNKSGRIILAASPVSIFIFAASLP